MYRVISNETMRARRQWIVVQDSGDGRPLMTDGPYMTERFAERVAAVMQEAETLQHANLRRFLTQLATRAVEQQQRPTAVEAQTWQMWPGDISTYLETGGVP